MASKDAANPPQPKPQNSDKIINSLKEILIPMDAKMTFIYDEMRLLKAKTEEATELANQAFKSSANAQTKANEAIKISNDNTLKLNKIEQRLKSLEEI